ncbi:hypothetical protein TorRG33x02_136090 [Trema orientale]|uniref:Epidermal patterning factor-like protein n=1 Tax=Trema orientale TaxID=63057 RepID=A0A2P5EYE9_TREOI|nr:hypothetical protein TorRG33x02_136090 [Trema orientale]
MQQEATRPRKLILALLMIITMLIHTCPVHMRCLQNSPSPSPANEMPKRVSHEKGRIGSSLVKLCNSKCNECEPCLPVEVSIRTMALEEKEYYYPQAWKCMCGYNIFSP